MAITRRELPDIARSRQNSRSCAQIVQRHVLGQQASQCVQIDQILQVQHLQKFWTESA